MKTLSIKDQIEETTKIAKKIPALGLENLINEESFLNRDTTSICRITTKNTIKFCNKDFIKISGYTEKELLTNSLDLIKHPEMPKIISEFIQYHIEKGRTMKIIIKNRTKDGKFFWTLSNFKPNNGSNLNISHSISSVAIPFKAKQKITKLYDCLNKLETKIDDTTAYKYLIGFLEERCMSLTGYTKHLMTLKE